MKSIYRIVILLIVFYAQDIYAQGCSDAGFCSIDGMKQNNKMQNDTALFPNTIKTGISLGNTRYSVWILNTYLSYSRQINKQMTVSIKLDGQYRTGELTQHAGFSDINLSMAHKLTESFAVVAGGKIPLSNANRTYNGISMPLAYQTSLGSYDAILGAQYAHNNLFLAFGWQQPLIQNDNRFMKGNFSEEQLSSKYPETNKFKRAGDVLLRISYKHKPATSMKKYSFTYSLLPVYHLKNDSYTNAVNKVIKIGDSQGLTLNTNIFVNYNVNDKTALELSVGFPLLARKERPEGLSQFALTVEFIKRF